MPNSEINSCVLELWMDAGKHAELSSALPAFIDVLNKHLPVAQMALYELNAPDQNLFLRYQWRAAGQLESPHRHCDLPLKTHQALLSWLRAAQSWTQQSGESGLPQLAALARAVPGMSDYFAPLHLTNGGYALLHLRFAKERLDAKDQTLLQAAAQPLAVMIGNDHRLQEMQCLRAAAEADRESLLARLGRTSLSSETIIGSESGLRAVMQRVAQVAPTNAGVLILGETGSGKEVIARAIHERSQRHDGPFIRVNCGAVPPDLLDSELFGHEKGSFTGAINHRRGWFERANGGTLFLDEIGELPLVAQVRLLRVLQDGILQRVGSETDIDVDVRVIAATHRDLPHMVQNGEFREDLWYRLAVFPIILPALHERPEDIEPLSRYFIERAAKRLGVPTPPLSKRDIERLQRYPWPGNVRELGAVLERAVILGHGRYLDLDAALGAQLLKPPIGKTAATNRSTIAALDDVIVAHLKQVLSHTNGRIDGSKGAAALLGINANTLRSKLRRYQIKPADFRAD